MLLDDRSVDWACAFIWLNEALSHAPLSSEGHISTMTDSVPSREACSYLQQLQVCKLLQHKDMVLYPEGLNSELEASQFTLHELSLWDATTPSKTTHEPQLIEVDLGSVQSESITTIIQAPNTPLVLPPSLVDTI